MSLSHSLNSLFFWFLSPNFAHIFPISCHSLSFYLLSSLTISTIVIVSFSLSHPFSFSLSIYLSLFLSISSTPSHSHALSLPFSALRILSGAFCLVHFKVTQNLDFCVHNISFFGGRHSTEALDTTMSIFTNVEKMVVESKTSITDVEKGSVLRMSNYKLEMKVTVKVKK